MTAARFDLCRQEVQMDPIPVYRAAHFLPYLELLKSVGAPVERDLRRARLPTYLSDQTDIYLPTIPTVAFLKAMSKREGIDDLGLRALLNLKMADLSDRIVASALGSPTLQAAFEHFCELAPLEDSSLRVWMSTDETSAQLCSATRCRLDAEGTLYDDWNLLLVLIAIVREFAGARWQPERMSFRSNVPPGPFASEQFPNTRFIAGQPAVSIHLPRELLSFPPRTKADLSKSKIRDAASLPFLDETQRDLIASLKAVLTPYLRECSPSIELAAEMGGTSIRTLQRRLQASGLSYSDLLRDVRYSAAARLLDETDVSVLEIAFELGYRDPSHFARAFRRTGGLSPRQFRARRRAH